MDGLMKEYDKLITLFKEKTPFSFARFNDGEMMGIEKVGAVVARSDQVVNESLHEKLIEAIKHRQENYWIGKPCGTCFPKHKKTYLDLVEEDYEYQTHAVVFINNGHWFKFMSDFTEGIGSRGVVWVSGEDQKVENVKGINIRTHIKFPRRNSWDFYDKIKPVVKDFKKDDVVIMSCGPLSRVLAYEWFKERKDCTFLDAGSIFDPYTRNVWHRCHTRTLPPCKECNYD
jgi:hypothetical protein